MIQHQSPISGVATFKDQYIATAGYDNAVILWNATTHMAMAVGRHDHLANQCEFSPCGRYLVSTGSDHTARLWRLPSMQLIAVLGYHQDDVETATFHPTQQWIATSSRDKIVRLFDFQGHLIRRFIGHERDVTMVAWLGQDNLLSSSDDGTVRKWDIHSGKQVATIDLGGVETDTIAVHPNGLIFAGNDEGNIIIISDQESRSISAHKSGIKRLCYSSKHNRLVSLSYDRKLIVWKINDKGEFTQVITATLPNCIWARSCAFLGDSKLILATFGSCYAIYDYQEDSWEIEQVKATHGVNAVLTNSHKTYSIGDSGIVYVDSLAHLELSGLCNFLLPFANTVVCGGQTGEIYNALTGDVIYQHHSPLNCGAMYSVEGKPYAIIGTYTGEGIVLELGENNQPCFLKTVVLHQNAVKGISADNVFIFSVCADYSAAFHDVKSLSVCHYLKNSHKKIANACVSMGQQRFISASRDLHLRIFSVEGVQVFTTQHTHSIKCLAVSHDKQFIASADYVGHIFIYDRCLNVIEHHRPTTAGISNISPGKHDDEFVASSYDGFLYFIKFDLLRNDTLNMSFQERGDRKYALD